MNNTKSESPIILIHDHIFKCAGTSVEISLKEFFADELIKAERNNDNNSTLNYRFICEIIKRNPEIKALTSHTIQAALPHNYKGKEILVFSLVRNPIDRCYSIYKFYKKNSDPFHPEEGFAASCSSYRTWLFYKLKTLDRRQLVNAQIRHFLYTNIPSLDPTTSELETALHATKSKNLILGTVERISESMTILECELRKLYPDIDLSIGHYNTSEGDPSEVLEAADLDIRTDNADQLLLNIANQSINNRIASITNFQELHLDYLKRCQNKSSASIKSKRISSNNKLYSLPLNRNVADKSLVSDNKKIEIIIKSHEGNRTNIFQRNECINVIIKYDDPILINNISTQVILVHEHFPNVQCETSSEYQLDNGDRDFIINFKAPKYCGKYRVDLYINHGIEKTQYLAIPASFWIGVIE